MAHSGVACLGVALSPWSSGLLVLWSPGPLVPWSSGLLVRWSLVAALGRLRMLQEDGKKQHLELFEKLGLKPMTTDAVFEMLRILSMTAF